MKLPFYFAASENWILAFLICRFRLIYCTRIKKHPALLWFHQLDGGFPIAPSGQAVSDCRLRNLLLYWQLHATYCFCSVTIFKCAQFKILLPIDICIHAHAHSLVNPILWNSRLRKYIEVELALKRSVDTASAFDCDCKPPDASPLMLAPAPDGCLLITDFACSTNLPDAACCYWRAGANLTPEWCLACSRLQKRCLARAMGMTMKLVGTHSEGPVRFKNKKKTFWILPLQRAGHAGGSCFHLPVCLEWSSHSWSWSTFDFVPASPVARH